MAISNAIRNQKKQIICPAPKTMNSKVRRQPQCDLKQNSPGSTKGPLRVWRKTIVVTKPKVKPRVPRLFRADRNTGLPLDYERTVSRIMRYVNPQHSQSPSPEKILEDHITRQLVEIFELCNCNNNFPCLLAKHRLSKSYACGPKSPKNCVYTDNMKLSEFHCAWLDLMPCA